MRKPNSIRFGHLDVKIKYISSKKATKLGIYGQIDTTKNIIELDRSLKPAILINTIIHEIIHLIASHYSWNIPAKDEELVAETLTNGLCDLLSQNPKILEYLAFALKKD